MYRSKIYTRTSCRWGIPDVDTPLIHRSGPQGVWRRLNGKTSNMASMSAIRMLSGPSSSSSSVKGGRMLGRATYKLPWTFDWLLSRRGEAGSVTVSLDRQRVRLEGVSERSPPPVATRHGGREALGAVGPVQRRPFAGAGNTCRSAGNQPIVETALGLMSDLEDRTTIFLFVSLDCVRPAETYHRRPILATQFKKSSYEEKSYVLPQYSQRAESTRKWLGAPRQPWMRCLLRSSLRRGILQYSQDTVAWIYSPSVQPDLMNVDAKHVR